MTDKSTSSDYATIFASRVFSPNNNSANDPTTIRSTVWICLAVSIVVCIVSTVTHNYSQVDKLWSILPPVYALILAKTPRTILMASLAAVWGLRLSANFYRRGGYVFPNVWKGEEDYRWSYVRQGYRYSMIPYLDNPWVWHVFNVLFISFYQNLLLWWIAMPSMIVYIDEMECHGTRRLTVVDWCLAAIFIALVVIETVADNQQYVFQTEKYRLQRSENDPSLLLQGQHYRDGFCQTGLFALVRKPNYAVEQGIWLTYYAFSVKWSSAAAAANIGHYGRFLNWSLLGWIQLMFLFRASSWLTEKITREKYPTYARYQEQTPLYIPFWKALTRTKRKD